MKKSLSAISLVVRDYDEAITFFTVALRFTLLEDTDMGDGKRWVRVAADSGSDLLLSKAVTPEQKSRIGNQTGGRVGFFLHTTDFQEEFTYMKAHGVRFTEEPRSEVYGTVVVFLDLYGNKWDLIQPKL